ncbi:MAG TPA: SDR family NAD(P)-dependent oxidoreductase, partial [Roseiarcus sp.]|nr:SDR family NAD(P)-dependent oxidoreductase [Roseiarcus sp.]
MTSPAVQPAQEFAGKTAIVTGGSGGIGRAIAAAFAWAGADVVIAARNNEAAERSAAAIRRETGARLAVIRTDVGVPAECAKLIDAAIAAFGAADILVNNAALFALVPLLDATSEDASRFF